MTSDSFRQLRHFLGRWRFVARTSGIELASRLKFLLVVAKLVNGLSDLPIIISHRT